MKVSGEKAKAILAQGASKYGRHIKDVVMVGDTLEVIIGTHEFVKAEVLKIINKGLRAFKRVDYMGVSAWRRWEVIYDIEKDEYIWNVREQICGNIVEITEQADGTQTEKIIGTSFRSWERAWE